LLTGYGFFLIKFQSYIVWVTS